MNLDQHEAMWQRRDIGLPLLGIANIAKANGAWIALYQSEISVAMVVCFQLAACVDNFLIQEYFDPFNDPWTNDLVTFVPQLNQKNSHSSLPPTPGLGVDLDLNLDVLCEHLYDPGAYLDTSQKGWKKCLETRKK